MDIYYKNRKEFHTGCLYAGNYIHKNNYILVSSIPTIYQLHNVHTVISIVTIVFPTLFNLIHINIPLYYRLPEDGEHSPKQVGQIAYRLRNFIHFICSCWYSYI